MLGVFAGIIATLAAVGFTEEQMGQFGMLVVAGGGLGLAIGRRVSPMQLPQTVAALHSVVGLAAVMTSAGSVLGSDPEHLTTLHLTTAYLGVLIGGVTFTGMSILSDVTDYQDLSWPSSSLVVECHQNLEFYQDDISSIHRYLAPICYR
jgi:NAD/NADP transhydrogenase beta subunit